MYEIKKLKVLPLEYWMTHPWTWDEEDARKMSRFKYFKPVGTDNIYFYRNRENSFAWFELGGIAYEYDVSAFLYKLSMLDAPHYTKEEYEALKLLRRNKILNKEMMENLHRYECNMEGRAIYRSATMKMMG